MILEVVGKDGIKKVALADLGTYRRDYFGGENIFKKKHF